MIILSIYFATIACIEPLGLLTVLNTFLKPKYKNPVIYYLLIPINLIVVCVSKYYLTGSRLSITIPLIFVLTYTIVFYSGKSFKKIFYCVITYLYSWLIDLLVIVMNYWVFGVTYNSYTQTNTYAVISPAISKLLFLISIMFTVQIIRSQKADLRWKDWFMLIQIPLLVFVDVILNMWDALKVGTVSDWMVARLISLILVQFSLFYLVDQLSEKYEAKLQNIMLEKENENLMESTKSLYNSHQKIREIWHDNNKHLNLINSMIQCGEIDKAQTYVKELCGQIHNSILPVNSHNIIVDTLLNNLYIKGLQDKIKIKYRLSSVDQFHISDTDMVALLANIMENAMEACVKCQSDRLIHISMGRKENLFFIACTNPTEGQVIIHHNQIVTTKSDKERHGFGIPRVQRIAEKYDGNMVLDWRGNVFKIVVSIPK